MRKKLLNQTDIRGVHISDNMLKLMRRQVTKEDTYRLIEQFRKEVPGIHLRTTLMVGHPGETEEDFEEEEDELDAESFMKMQCENCKHYCPYCGKCSLGE